MFMSAARIALNRSTQLFFTLIAGLMLTTAAPYLLAQSASNTNPAPTVVFGGSSHYPPFHFYNDQGIADGFDVSIFKHIAASAGWQTAYRLDDWELIQQALVNGEIDMVPMFVSEERASRYLFSNALHVEHHLLFGPATSDAYASLTDLGQERIAAEGGAFATAELLKINPDVVIINADSEADALDRVARGAADLALLPAEIGRYTVRTRQLDQLVVLSPPLLPVNYAFAVNRQRPELLAAANAIIEQLQRRGELEALRESWLHPESTVGSARERALLVASWTLPLLLMLAVAVLLTWRYYRLQLEAAQSTMAERLSQLRHAVPPPATPSTTPGTGGLPDRKQLQHKLEYEIAVARQQHVQRAFVLVSVLNLDALQDAFDDDAGNEMLEQLVTLIPLEQVDYCGEYSTGVFGFIFSIVEDIERDVGELLIQCSQPVNIRDMSMHPQLCAGITLFPDHGNSAAELMHKAKMAMNQARRTGASLLMFSPEMKPDPRRIQVISDLRHALVQRELRWAVQPQFHVADRRVYGAELLARWQHHTHGWMSPGEFIPWAEEAGLISQVSNQVIDESVALLEALSAQKDTFCLSINLSSNDLSDDELVSSLIERVRGKASRLTVEVTETALMRSKHTALRNIDRLKRANFRVALDDYGTGYASMEYLQSFQFDEIKIDRRFINNMTSIERNRKLTRASIELAHQLGASVVAEGVEDNDTADMLIDMGCDILQGYQIGRPVLLGDLNAIRQSWDRALA